METLQEALDKSQEISGEIDKVLDIILAYPEGKSDRPITNQEWEDLQARYTELHKQRLLIYQEINRLSNGVIHISKDGNKVTIRNKPGI